MGAVAHFDGYDSCLALELNLALSLSLSLSLSCAQERSFVLACAHALLQRHGLTAPVPPAGAGDTVGALGAAGGGDDALAGCPAPLALVASVAARCACEPGVVGAALKWLGSMAPHLASPFKVTNAAGTGRKDGWLGTVVGNGGKHCCCCCCCCCCFFVL